MDSKDEITISYIKENYEILEEISEGEVYLVRNSLDERKYIYKKRSVYDLEVYKTLKENRPKGVPVIYEMVRDGDELIVIEEFIEGVRLESAMKSVTGDKEDFIVNVGTSLCDILSTLHAYDPPIIHRDINPNNIMITGTENDMQVYLIDFNISRHFTGESKQDTFVMGTHKYAAPEQYGFSETDSRSDIYGLGVTLKYLMAELGVNTDKLDTVVKKATAFDPVNRYRSAADMKSALDSKNGRSIVNVLRKYAPPGFRSDNVIYMLFATMVYIIMFVVIADFKMGGEKGNKYVGLQSTLYNHMGRTVIIMNAVFMIALWGNYLGFKDKILSALNLKEQNKVVKIFVMIIISILFWIVVQMVGTLFDTFVIKSI